LSHFIPARTLVPDWSPASGAAASWSLSAHSSSRTNRRYRSKALGSASGVSTMGALIIQCLMPCPTHVPVFPWFRDGCAFHGNTRGLGAGAAGEGATTPRNWWSRGSSAYL
jgi:hypothetical protein